MVSLRSQSPGSSRERGKPYRASRGFRGINGVLPAARVPSIYSTVLLTPFQAGGVRPMSGTDPMQPFSFEGSCRSTVELSGAHADA